MIGRLLQFLFGCMHSNPGWPINGIQRCVQCGAWRMYKLRLGGGIVWGKWMRPEIPAAPYKPVLQEVDEGGLGVNNREELQILAPGRSGRESGKPWVN